MLRTRRCAEQWGRQTRSESGFLRKAIGSTLLVSSSHRDQFRAGRRAFKFRPPDRSTQSLRARAPRWSGDSARARIQAAWRGHVVRRELVHAVRRDFEETVRRLEGPPRRATPTSSRHRASVGKHTSRGPCFSRPAVRTTTEARRSRVRSTGASARADAASVLDVATERRLEVLRRELEWARNALDDRRQHLRRLRRDTSLDSATRRAQQARDAWRADESTRRAPNVKEQGSNLEWYMQRQRVPRKDASSDTNGVRRAVGAFERARVSADPPPTDPTDGAPQKKTCARTSHTFSSSRIRTSKLHENARPHWRAPNRNTLRGSSPRSTPKLALRERRISTIHPPSRRARRRARPSRRRCALDRTSLGSRRPTAVVFL